MPTEVEGVSGEENIAEMWKVHFETLFNSIDDVPSELFHDLENLDDVSVNDIELAMKDLQPNKVCGSGGAG